MAGFQHRQPRASLTGASTAFCMAHGTQFSRGNILQHEPIPMLAQLT